MTWRRWWLHTRGPFVLIALAVGLWVWAVVQDKPNRLQEYDDWFANDGDITSKLVWLGVIAAALAVVALVGVFVWWLHLNEDDPSGLPQRPERPDPQATEQRKKRRDQTDYQFGDYP